MPPIRSQTSINSIEQEGRIELAIQAIRKEGFTSIREVARCFIVPKATLCRRLHGVQNRAISRANSHILTEIEEQTLRK